MDHRYRAAPIALARHQPVAQAIVDRAFARACRGELFDGGALGVVDPLAVEELRMGQGAVADIGLVADRERRRVGVVGDHHRADR